MMRLFFVSVCIGYLLGRWIVSDSGGYVLSRWIVSDSGARDVQTDKDNAAYHKLLEGSPKPNASIKFDYAPGRLRVLTDGHLTFTGESR